MALRKIRLVDDMYYCIRAVDTEEDGRVGVLRMSVRRRNSNRKSTHIVKGLSAIFREKDGNLDFGMGGLFFYGHARDLDRWYNGPTPQRFTTGKYKDKEFSPSNTTWSKYMDHGFLMIPYEDMMDVSSDHKSIVEKVVESSNEHLPDLVSRLERVDLDRDNLSIMRGFRKGFSLFPAALKDEALAKGYFYKELEDQTSSASYTCNLPTIRVISTPMGGLPAWAKRYMQCRH